MQFALAHPWMTFFLGLAGLSAIATIAAAPRVVSVPGVGTMTAGRQWVVSPGGVRRVA